jgi:hypothetical protein
MQELPQASGGSYTILSFYCPFRLFARPEACLWCYCFSSNVDGARFDFDEDLDEEDTPF